MKNREGASSTAGKKDEGSVSQRKQRTIVVVRNKEKALRWRSSIEPYLYSKTIKDIVVMKTITGVFLPLFPFALSPRGNASLGRC